MSVYRINNRCGINLLFLLASVILYFLSPIIYIQSYCVVLFVLFLLNALILYIQDRKNEPLGFNVLFTVSFFLVTYIYPVFIYPIMPNYSLFVYEINSDVITKATALSNVAYAAYSVGYSRISSNVNLEKKFIQMQLVPIRQEDKITGIEVFLFILIIFTGGLDYFSDTYFRGEANASALFRFIYTIFQSFTIFYCIIDCTSKGFKKSVVIGVIILLFLSTGTRTLPLCLMSIYLCYYSLRWHVSTKKVFIGALIVFILFSLIGHWRGSDDGLSNMIDSELVLFDSVRDFIICNRNLYAIYDYVNNESITYGVSSLSYMLAPIPFLQSFVSFLFGILPYEMRSETLTSYWALGEGSSLGLGTHIVGDVYLSFGFIGVLFLFYFLGKLVTSSRMKGINGTPSALIIYYVLVAGAIFMCRGSFFYCLKNIVWGLFFWYIFNYKYRSKEFL